MMSDLSLSWICKLRENRGTDRYRYWKDCSLVNLFGGFWWRFGFL